MTERNDLLMSVSVECVTKSGELRSPVNAKGLKIYILLRLKDFIGMTITDKLMSKIKCEVDSILDHAFENGLISEEPTETTVLSGPQISGKPTTLYVNHGDERLADWIDRVAVKQGLTR